MLENYVDDLISSLIAINNLFVGNYALKDKTWCVIISLLEKVRQRLPEMSKVTIQSLLGLKIISFIFNNFEEQSHYEKEEALYARRILKDNTGAEIDGIPRKDVERLVY